MIEKEIVNQHDVRYLRDDEISLSTKMAIKNRQHLHEDYIKFIKVRLDEDNELVENYDLFVDFLNIWTEEYVALNHLYQLIKYKVFRYQEDECLVSFYDMNKRNLFSVTISNQL